MFKIPLVVVQIDERRRQGDAHILQLTLSEVNEDDRINLGELTLVLKIRDDNEPDPTKGFDRKRFDPGDVWYLVKQEKKKEGDPPVTESPTVNE